MGNSVGTRYEIILPDEFAKIASVFHDLLEELDLSPESEGADTLAADLIKLYQSGTHDVQALKLLMKPKAREF
jgi:hypothetical protein